MVTAMVATMADVLTDIEHLDFSTQLPCEVGWGPAPDDLCGEPSAYWCTYRSRIGGNPSKPVCKHCAARIVRGGWMIHMRPLNES